MNKTNTSEFCHLALAVIETEAKAIGQLASRIDAGFNQACELILACQGRVVVTGMGKSGHIANKIAATLASTGTPAFFVHPGEASHGDMGMITKQDVVIALSNSGETREILTILPLLKRLAVPLISLTGKLDSSIAHVATVNLDVSVAEEACPLGLAPTASTTAALVMGDALAIALLNARGFSANDFALSHPGGSLGRRLLLYVEDIMHTGTTVPIVKAGTKLSEALIEITAKKLGMTTVVDENGSLLGIFTDGDLRRVIEKKQDIHSVVIQDLMNANCKTIAANVLAAEALNIMENFKITSLVVTDDHKQLVGVIHMHDILQEGIS